MNREKLKDIVKELESLGYDVKFRDVAFFYLKKSFDGDEEYAYKCLFINESESVNEYKKSKKIKFLEGYLTNNVDDFKAKKVADVKDSLSFEENREGLENELKGLLEMRAEGESTMDTKEKRDLTKLIADIRFKLDSKLSVKAETANQFVHVNTKFELICPHTRRECSYQTKEFVMKRYNLIDNTNIK